VGLTLWQGIYEGTDARWLRWCDAQGTVIPTGEERVPGKQPNVPNVRL